MALMVNLSITLLILVAITAFTIETFPAYYGRDVAPFPQGPYTSSLPVFVCLIPWVSLFVLLF